MDRLPLSPAWKEAVHAFIETSPKPGDLVTRAQLEEWLGMKRPTRGTFDEMRAFELKFLSSWDSWCDHLLRKHQIQFDIRDRNADGWRVLAPSEVAAFTRRHSDKELRRALRRQRERLSHTDLSELNQDQTREHAETLIRCSWKLRAIKEVDKRPLELPSLPAALPRKK